jgi:hypothetical protein
VIWFDEERDIAVYSEALMRTMKVPGTDKDGRMLVTYACGCLSPGRKEGVRENSLFASLSYAAYQQSSLERNSCALQPRLPLSITGSKTVYGRTWMARHSVGYMQALNGPRKGGRRAQRM